MDGILIKSSHVSESASSSLKLQIGVQLVTLLLVAASVCMAGYTQADCRRGGRYVPEDWWTLQLRDLREDSIHRSGLAEGVLPEADSWATLEWSQLPAVARQLVSQRSYTQLTDLAESVAIRWRSVDDMPSEASLLELTFYLGRHIPADVQKAMSESLCDSYSVGEAAPPGWAADVAGRLVGALSELDDIPSASKAATEWTLAAESFETSSLEELAYISYGLVGDQERTGTARGRLAEFICQSRIVDKSVVEAESPIVWRVLARRLASEFSYEDCELWSRMLQEALFRKGVPRSQLGADGLHLYDALLAVDDIISQSTLVDWLDQREDLAGIEPYLLAWNLDRIGNKGQTYRDKLLDFLTAGVDGSRSVQRLGPRDWHVTALHLKEWLKPHQSQLLAEGIQARFCKDLKSFSRLPDLDKYHVVKTTAKHLGHSEVRELIAGWINQGESWKDTRLSTMALLLRLWKEITDDNHKAMTKVATHLSNQWFSSPKSVVLASPLELFVVADCLDMQCPENPAKSQWGRIIIQAFACDDEVVAALDSSHFQLLLKTLECLGYKETADLLVLEQRLRDKLGRQPSDRVTASQFMDTIVALQLKRIAALPRSKHEKSWQLAKAKLDKLAQVGGWLGAEGVRSVEQLASMLDQADSLTGEQVFIDVQGLCSDPAAGFDLRMSQRRFLLFKMANSISDDLIRTVQQAVSHFQSGQADKAKDSYLEALSVVESEGDQKLISLIRWALLDASFESISPDRNEIDAQISALKKVYKNTDGDLTYFALRSLVGHISLAQSSQVEQFEAGLKELPVGPVWIDQDLLDGILDCLSEAGDKSRLMQLTNMMLIVDDVPSLRRIQALRVQSFSDAGDLANALRGKTLYAVLGLATPEGPLSEIFTDTESSVDAHELVRQWVEAGNNGTTGAVLEVDEPLRAAAQRDEAVFAHMAAWRLALSGDADNAVRIARASLKTNALGLDVHKRNLFFVSMVLAGSEIGEAARLVSHDLQWYGRWQNWPILWGVRAFGDENPGLAIWAWAMAIDGAARGEDASGCVESLMALASRSGLSESLLAALVEVPQYVHSIDRNRDVWLQFAGYFYEAGELSAAVTCFQRADDSGPAIADERALIRRIQRVTAMGLLERHSEALAILEEASTLPKSPEDEAQLQFLQAWLNIQLSHWDLAYNALEQLAKSNAPETVTEAAARLRALVEGQLSTIDVEKDYDQERLTNLLSMLESDPAGQAFTERLILIEEVTQQISQSIEAHRQNLLRRLLARVAGLPAVSVGSDGIADANFLYHNYAFDFERALSVPPIDDDDLALLRKHYNRVISVAGAKIFLRGSDVVALDRQAGPDIGCQCLVLPILAGLRKPSPQQFAKAPEWFHSDDVRRATEEFAISLGMPFVALSLSPSVTPDSPEATMDRLHKEGERLTYAYANYQQAVAYFNEMIKIATEGDLGDRAMVGAIALAEVYSRMEQPELAAGTIEAILSEFPMAKLRHRGAALRLQYLYAAEQFSIIADEWSEYYDSSFSEPKKAGILYLAWIANRRLNRSMIAEQLAIQFLESFPDHPSGAAVHFSMAMDALARGDNETCQGQFELIELRYPSTSLMSRIKQIQQKLQAGSYASGKN